VLTILAGYHDTEEQESKERRRLRRERHERQKKLDREVEVNRGSSAANRKGFMPSFPGGDEPPAPRGNYFTQRDKPSVSPSVPTPEQFNPRAAPALADLLDLLKSSRQKAMPTTVKFDTPYMMQEEAKFDSFESSDGNIVDPTTERSSTPYAMHGGEKFDPFACSDANTEEPTTERPSTPYAK
jgi:hypothetical protein